MVDETETTPAIDLDERLLGQLFIYYEAERRALGIGSTLVRLTPSQCADAIAIFTVARHAAPAQNATDYWMARLRPVLAETTQSSQALKRAFARLAKPKTEAPPPSTPIDLRAGFAQAQTPQNDWRARSWRFLQKFGTAMAVGALVAALIAVAAFTSFSIEEQHRPDAGSGSKGSISFPGGAGSSAQSGASNPAATGRAEYERVLLVVTAAAQQRSDDITPAELATVLAAEFPSAGVPATILAAMLETRPLPPDVPLARNASGAGSLQQYAAVVAGLVTHAAPASYDPMFTASRASAPQSVRRLSEFSTPDKPPGAMRPANLVFLPPFLAWLLGVPALIAAVWGVLSWRSAIRRVAQPLARDAARQKMRWRRNTATARGWESGDARVPTTGGAPAAPRALVRRLAAREPEPGRKLDTVRSTLATVKSDGVLVAVMRPASRAVEYVVLVNRRNQSDLEAARLGRMFHGLDAGGLNATVYEYQPDLRTIWPIQDDVSPLDLRALRERHPNARLVIVTDGRDLIDRVSQRADRVIAQEVRTWPQRVWLTPVPTEDWGEREMLVSWALDAMVGRATSVGLTDLVRGFDELTHDLYREAMEKAERAPSYIERIVTWSAASRSIVETDPLGGRPSRLRSDDPRLISDHEPPVEIVRAVLLDLKRWLGPHGFYWHAATGIYPQLRFDLTLWLGSRLSRYAVPSNPPLFDEMLLARLTILPWYRAGRMPQWLRRAVFAALERDEQAQATDLVRGLLDGRERGASGTQLKFWWADPRGLNAPRDAVMIDLLAGEAQEEDEAPASAEQLALIEREREEALAKARRGLMVRRLGIVLFLLVWGLVGLRLWPAGPAPFRFGVWYPLATYVVSSAVFLAFLVMIGIRAGGRRPDGKSGDVAPPAIRRRVEEKTPDRKAA